MLLITHVFDPAYGPAAQHAAGWEAYLARLDAHLAGGFLSEEQAHGPIGCTSARPCASARTGARAAHDRRHRRARPDARGRPRAAPRAPLYRHVLHPLLCRALPRRRRFLRATQSYLPYFAIGVTYDDTRARWGSDGLTRAAAGGTRELAQRSRG